MPTAQDFRLLEGEYASRGLVIMAFPCNQARAQERSTKGRAGRREVLLRGMRGAAPAAAAAAPAACELPCAAGPKRHHASPDLTLSAFYIKVQFMKQEPGSNEAIKMFMRSRRFR